MLSGVTFECSSVDQFGLWLVVAPPAEDQNLVVVRFYDVSIGVIDPIKKKLRRLADPAADRQGGYEIKT